MQTMTAFSAVIFLTAIDQVTKHYAAIFLKEGAVSVIPGVFELHYLENRGMAFSLLQNRMGIFYVGTVLFLLIALYFWFKMPADKKYAPLRILLVILVSGAIGNFIDRIVLKYVRDFLYFSLIDFPIFNVADMYVTCSAILLVYFLLFRYREEDFEFPEKKSGSGKEK